MPLTRYIKQSLATVLAAFMLLIPVVTGCDGLTSWNPTGYTVTYDLNGASVDGFVTHQSVKADEPLTLPHEPSRTGYRFDGWFLDGALFLGGECLTRNITLQAKWNKLYTISFDPSGGTPIPDMQACAGDDIVSPTPSKGDAAFRGWYTQQGERFWFSVMPEGDFHLTASWSSGYQITFDVGLDATPVKEISAVSGSYVYEPEPPMRAGYAFDGWYLDGAPYRFGIMPSRDITVTARWVMRTVLPTVHVTLMNEDGSVMPLSVIDDMYLPQYTLNVVDPRPYHSARVGIAAESGTLNLVDAEIKGRGNGSWKGQKKNYRIKFAQKQEVLGMPASRHWVLMANAWNQPDYTNLRTDIAYGMARQHLTNLEYAARTVSVDLYVNNAYHGVYTLSEQVRVADDRVNLDSQHGELDTGYLLNYAGDTHMNGVEGINWFRLSSSFRRAPSGVNGNGQQAAWFAVRSPDADDYAVEGLTETQFRAQVGYIKSYMQQVADVLIGLQSGASGRADVEALLDIDSFVDMYIMQELYKNQDAGWGGFYLYKKSSAEGGKLWAGPPWDWDWVTSNTLTTYQNIAVGTGTGVSQINPFCTYLYQTSWFKSLVRTRFGQIKDGIKDYFHARYAAAFIADEANRYAFGRNLTRWTMDVNLAIEPYASNSFRPVLSQADGESTWADYMNRTRNWLINRIDWLATNW